MASLYLYIPVIIAVYALTKRLFHKLQNLPPSPISLPILGHLYLLKRPLHRSLSEISKRYGPIVFLRFGSQPVVLVSSPSVAEECFSKNDVVFANRPRLLSGKYLGYNHTTVAWAPYGDHWRNLRRIASLELLSTHRIQALSTVRLDELKLMIRGLLSRQDDVVDVRTALAEFTLNIMMRMIAGKRYYGDNVSDLEEAKTFRHIQQEAFRLSGSNSFGDYLPFVRWFGAFKRWEKSITELVKERNGFMQCLIEQQKSRIRSHQSTSATSQDGRKTLIEVLLKLQQTEPDYYRDEIVRGLMFSMLIGGTETTTHTMEWSLALLLNHPQILKKAQAEIDECVGHDRLVEESDLAQLPYLQSIINETLRMYPIAPLLLPHYASEKCVVGGFDVPAGTTLFVNARAIQNDPSIWEDPESFKPERFELEGKNGLKLMPFGSGRRGCPGENLAMRVMCMVLGSLIQCFDWERPDHEMVDLTEGIGFSLPMAHPLLAKCRPRPAMSTFLSRL